MLGSAPLIQTTPGPQNCCGLVGRAKYSRSVSTLIDDPPATADVRCTAPDGVRLNPYWGASGGTDCPPSVDYVDAFPTGFFVFDAEPGYPFLSTPAGASTWTLPDLIPGPLVTGYEFPVPGTSTNGRGLAFGGVPIPIRVVHAWTWLPYQVYGRSEFYATIEGIEYLLAFLEADIEVEVLEACGAFTYVRPNFPNAPIEFEYPASLPVTDPPLDCPEVDCDDVPYLLGEACGGDQPGDPPVPVWLAQNISACRVRNVNGRCYLIGPTNTQVDTVPPGASVQTEVIGSNSPGPFSCCDCEPGCASGPFARARCDGSEPMEPLECCCSDTYSAEVVEFSMVDRLEGPNQITYTYSLVSPGLLRVENNVTTINQFFQVRSVQTVTDTGIEASNFVGDFPVFNPLSCGTFVLPIHPATAVSLGANGVPAGCPLQVGRTFTLSDGTVAYVRGLTFGHGCTEQRVTGVISYYPPGTPTDPPPVSGEIGESEWTMVYRIAYDGLEARCQGECASVSPLILAARRSRRGCSRCGQDANTGGATL